MQLNILSSNIAYGGDLSNYVCAHYAGLGHIIHVRVHVKCSQTKIQQLRVSHRLGKVEIKFQFWKTQDFFYKNS